MRIPRTDLAMEASRAAGEISGVKMEQERIGSSVVTRISVQNEQGARAIGKPIGTYITIEDSNLCNNKAQDDHALAQCIARQLLSLIDFPTAGCALVVGLGNRELTPDSLGPRVTQQILVSRHILRHLPGVLDARVHSVCVLTPGVMGTTGMETEEVVKAVVRTVRPSCVILVDALAARSTERILSTVQITDTGAVPGSGVGNHRRALTRDTLGVPVLAVGVPTVVHASTILHDALEALSEKDFPLPDASLHSPDGQDLVVTPVGIDASVRISAAVVADAINLALQPELAPEEIRALCI